MAKKDFSQVGAVLENVTAEPQQTPDAQEVTKPTKQMRQVSNTQGRKGQKAIRINMAFTPEVHEYIRIMSRARGESVTVFTNLVFQQSMEANAELYEKMKKLVNAFKKQEEPWIKETDF